MTSGSEEKLFLSRVWRPAWLTVPALAAFEQNRGVMGKGAEWMCLDSQVEEGKYLAMPLGEGIQASSPHQGMPFSHRIRPCLHPAPCAASHSVFRVTDLISWIIFQAGHRWGIKLKTWHGMGHKGWILGASPRDDMKGKWIL